MNYQDANNEILAAVREDRAVDTRTLSYISKCTGHSWFILDKYYNKTVLFFFMTFLGLGAIPITNSLKSQQFLTLAQAQIKLGKHYARYH